MKFWLGAHRPSWLDRDDVDVPLFVSRTTLPRRRMPRARVPWALDSGGFSELQRHGAWTITPAEYVATVRSAAERIGRLEWAAPMDWMCEPQVIHGGEAGGLEFAGTGLSTREHQARTVDNLLELRAMAPDLPFIPVLQGWRVGDYTRCAELYRDAGVDLAAEPIVGVGSVCRRQNSLTTSVVFHELAGRMGLRCHGFGVKTTGLRQFGHHLVSADSLAWSRQARYERPFPGHPHKSCANCPEYALAWRSEVLARLDHLERTARAGEQHRDATTDERAPAGTRAM